MADIKIIKICGGLGNQMFQYAFGEVLKQKGNKVFYDTSWYQIERKKGATPRPLELTHFHVNLALASVKDIQRISGEYCCGIRIPGFIRSFFSHQINEEKMPRKGRMQELLNISGDSYFVGTFADFDYLKPCKKDILKAFYLKTPLTVANQEMMEKIKQTNSVCIHVRRGDFVKLGLACDMSYYEKAIAQIQTQVKNSHFFIFSDDLAWVRENLKIADTHTFVDINDGNTGYFDLELMKHCKHNICANSTFSLWAAYLNENPQKITLSPDDFNSTK